jgi:erythromycin esterase
MAAQAPEGVTIVPARAGVRVAVAAALAVAVAIGTAGSVAHAARADPSPGPVTRWIAQHAAGIETVGPTAPLDDLAPLRRSIGDAQIVGLGESVHGAAEEIRLKHRVLRLLVERMGFRSLAWEEDWATGRQIDEYIRGGAGDLDALVGRMTPQWHSAEVADVLRWLRDYNTGRTDQVRFMGVDYYLTGQAAYDAITEHVARVAPQRLPALRELFRLLRPTTPDVFQHIRQYMSVPASGSRSTTVW